MKIPDAQAVSRALRATRTAVKKALKGTNQAAGQCMAKGDYATAEALVARGREIKRFQTEVDDLRKRWREVSGGGKSGSQSPTTPLWHYYQPILQALAQAGGGSGHDDLEEVVGKSMGPSFQPGDTALGPGGRERWRTMVRRARRPLVTEGWLEAGKGVWRITDAGRRAAEKPLTKDPAR